ncbi:MAG TPA: hypothetical protein VNV14_08125, partial [Opitutaceae bacterium]|nr:hypothetical protein [Opitutaceae bacterium]
QLRQCVAQRLAARHKVRLADLNAQQYGLEQVNTELGFLFPRADREEHGKITYEGRFRVWKEILLLNYFGRSARYE